MTLTRYKSPPDVTGNTVLRDCISVILPIERTNLITNPSFETNATGYTSVDGATLTRTTEKQRRGVFSLKVKPGLSQTSGLYYTSSSLTAGTAYVFSCDVFIRGGMKYTISIYDGIRTVAQRQIVGKGYWERVNLGAVLVTTGAHRFYLQKDGHNDTREFYTDGWQLEECAAGEMFPTTYIDGDLNGFVINQVPPAFYWTGEPHASTSIRGSQTRAGGRVVNLKEYGLQMLTLIGLGMSPINNVATPFGLIGGAVYQRTVPGVRGFTLVASLTGDNRAQLDRNRRMLEDAFKPDAVSIQQPLILRYQNMDCDDPNGEELDIVCNYAGGLEGNIDNFHQERIGIKFSSYYPYLIEEGDQSVMLDFADNVAQSAFIIQRKNDGSFASIGVINGVVFAVAEGNDGLIYIGGSFTSAGGTPIQRITKWDSTSRIFSPLGFGANDRIRAIQVGLDGSIYAAGRFTSIGTVTTTGIARWTGSAWVALGSGLSGGGATEAFALAMDINGNIYVGGNFTSAGGVANTSGIAKWNITTQIWEAVGTGVTAGNNEVDSLARALDGSIWAGGRWDTMGGVANTSHIARWTGSAWVSVATGATGGSIIRTISVAPNGLVYAGGDFTSISGVTASKIAYYNGTNWFPLGSGVNDEVYAIAFDGKGNTIVGGLMTVAGGLTLIDMWAIWNGSSWVYAPCDLPGATAGSNVVAIFVSHAYDWYVGFNDSTSIGTSGGIAVVDNGGIASVAPKFIIDGPGKIIQLDNYNTGDSIWFDLTLVSGERAILDLTPGNISFKSDVRGSLLGKILPGSKLTSFRLQPGTNRIGVFIKDAGVGTAVYLNWRNTHWDIAGSIRR